MSARVVHFELPYDDAERARQFYASVFDWQLVPMPDMGYTLVMTGPSGDRGPEEPGFVNGGMFERKSGFTSPCVVLDVPDLDAALEWGRRLVRATTIPIEVRPFYDTAG